MKLFINSLSVGLLLVALQPTTEKRIGSRIIGGDVAKAGQFPFAAALYVQKPSSTTFCGGILLSTLWILTAGHCLDGATLVTIQLGSTNLRGTDPNRVTLATESMVVHPLFDRQTLENDLGLIMFRMHITETDYIKHISYFPIDDLPGSAPVTTFGWGQTSDDVAGLTNELHYVEMTTLTNEECSLIYGPQVYDNMVCTAGNYNEGICLGDSGSPLIQNVAGGHSLIVGVASFMSVNGCENTDPSGYTRIFPYKVWIHNVTGIAMS